MKQITPATAILLKRIQMIRAQFMKNFFRFQRQQQKLLSDFKKELNKIK